MNRGAPSLLGAVARATVVERAGPRTGSLHCLAAAQVKSDSPLGTIGQATGSETALSVVDKVSGTGPAGGPASGPGTDKG